MIAIVAYGLGNVRAFLNIFERHGVAAKVADSAEDLRHASHVILPGVGSFDWAMQKLTESGLRDVLNEVALEKRRPVLGVCVGMQMMVESSEEGVSEGLGWISGDCRRLQREEERVLPLPHMGWNDIVPRNDEPLLRGLGDDTVFYFLHSYHVVPTDPVSAIAHANYGGRFVCAVRKDNLSGVQFHPEKSHHWGERVLLNFASL